MRTRADGVGIPDERDADDAITEESVCSFECTFFCAFRENDVLRVSFSPVNNVLNQVHSDDKVDI